MKNFHLKGKDTFQVWFLIHCEKDFKKNPAYKRLN